MTYESLAFGTTLAMYYGRMKKKSHKDTCKDPTCICRAKSFPACPHCSGIESVRLKTTYIKDSSGNRIRVLTCPECDYRGWLKTQTRGIKMTVYLAARRQKEFSNPKSAIAYVKRSCKHGDYVSEWDKTNSRIRTRFLICANGETIDLVRENSPEFVEDIQWIELS